MISLSAALGLALVESGMALTHLALIPRFIDPEAGNVVAQAPTPATSA